MADAPVTGTRLPLPPGARGPFLVYVDGVEQGEGADYRLEADAIRFTRPLRTGRREGLWKKLVMSTAGIGFYGEAQTVDLHYTEASGVPGVASGLHVEPD
jgi:hypothetical protein